MNIEEIILLTTWFGSGLLVVIGCWITDMRGKEFNENYFSVETGLLYFVVLLFGWISLIIACHIYCNNKKLFTRFIYKIANIGIKNKEE